MKFSTIVDIFIELLSKRRVTAAYLSEKYDLSPRTVYRYVSVLAESVPLQITRGRNGGITLADQFKLPVNFFTAAEHAALNEALKTQYSNSADARFLQVLDKLNAQERAQTPPRTFSASAEELFVRENAFPNAEKLRVLADCIQTSSIAEIEYKGSLQRIEPHALLFEDGGWSTYAFSYETRAFALFPLGRLASIVKGKERYRKRPFELPPATPTKTVNVRLEIRKGGLLRAADRLGIEHVRKREGGYIADLSLPEDGLPERILALGDAVQVLSPASLKSAVKALAEKIADQY